MPSVVRLGMPISAIKHFVRSFLISQGISHPHWREDAVVQELPKSPPGNLLYDHSQKSVTRNAVIPLWSWGEICALFFFYVFVVSSIRNLSNFVARSIMHLYLLLD